MIYGAHSSQNHQYPETVHPSGIKRLGIFGCVFNITHETCKGGVEYKVSAAHFYFLWGVCSRSYGPFEGLHYVCGICRWGDGFGVLFRQPQRTLSYAVYFAVLGRASHLVYALSL